MDATLAQLVLGVVGNGLFALSTTAWNAVPTRSLETAVGESLGDLADVPAIDPRIGGERLRSFLCSSEAEEAVRRIFATRLVDSASALDQARRAFASSFSYWVTEDEQTADRLFAAMVTGVEIRLQAAAASAGSREEAIEALGVVRHNFVMGGLAAIEKQLSIIVARSAPPQRSFEHFIAQLNAQIAQRTGWITPPNFDGARRVAIDDLYVAPEIVLSHSGKRIEFGELHRYAQRLVILGSPGGGKTTLAKKLCHERAGSASGATPLLITLREFGIAKRERQVSVRGFLEEQAVSNHQLDVPPGAFEYLLATGAALVIFDGLDELLDTSYRASITEDIEAFCALYPATRVLVTSRVVGYEQAPLDPTQFSTARLASFDVDRVRRYAKKWFASGVDTGEVASGRQAADFMEESEDVADLRSNPLMLALMCNIYRGDGFIPKNRPDVYGKCAVMLFERWDRGRRLVVPLEFERHLRPALQHLAYWIYSDSELPSGVSEQRLVREVTAYLHGRRFPDEDLARAEAIKFIEFCRGRAWVFTDTGTTAGGERLYQFTHPTFLEYFAAAHLVRQSRTPQALIDILLPRIEHGEWDVLAQLAFQLQDDGLDTADELLEEVAAVEVPGSGEGQLRLSFAVRSLAFLVPSPQVTSGLSRTVTLGALDVFAREDDNHESRDARVDTFAHLLDANWENRAAVVAGWRSALQAMASMRPLPGDAIAELALSVDMATLGAKRAGVRSEWELAILDQSLPIIRELRGGEESFPLSWDQTRFGLIDPAELISRFGPSAVFACRTFKLYRSCIRGALSDRFVRAVLGVDSIDIPHDGGDDGEVRLAMIGRAVREYEPPWHQTDLHQVGAGHMFRRATRDVHLSGDALHGALAACAVNFEIALHGDEVGPYVRSTKTSGSRWVRGLSELMELRLTDAGDLTRARQVASQFELADSDQEFWSRWANGETDLVVWEKSPLRFGV